MTPLMNTSEFHCCSMCQRAGIHKIKNIQWCCKRNLAVCCPQKLWLTAAHCPLTHRQMRYLVNLMIKQNCLQTLPQLSLRPGFYCTDGPQATGINRPVSQMQAPLGGLLRTSGKLWQDYSSWYMFLNIKMWYLLIRAQYTHIMVFWHISNIWILRIKLVGIPPRFV